MCWHANNQGTESLALAAATLIHFPIQRGKHPSPAPSTLQPGMRSAETWAKTWSSHAETDGGTWGMVQVPRKPCQCTHLAAGGASVAIVSIRRNTATKALGSEVLNLRQRAPGNSSSCRDSWRA